MNFAHFLQSLRAASYPKNSALPSPFFQRSFRCLKSMEQNMNRSFRGSALFRLPKQQKLSKKREKSFRGFSAFFNSRESPCTKKRRTHRRFAKIKNLPSLHPGSRVCPHKQLVFLFLFQVLFQQVKGITCMSDVGIILCALSVFGRLGGHE